MTGDERVTIKRYLVPDWCSGEQRQLKTEPGDLAPHRIVIPCSINTGCQKPRLKFPKHK